MARINAVMVPVMLTAMWFVAPQGVVWVAVVHLVVAMVFTVVRQLVVNRIVDAEGARVLSALVPGTIVAMCVLACALPVRLSTDEGFVSMLLIVAAGAVGGLVGLGISRSARDEAKDLLVKLRG
jgi:membrane protein insertase Oxa1/YidC/SpoIIIJ